MAGRLFFWPAVFRFPGAPSPPSTRLLYAKSRRPEDDAPFSTAARFRAVRLRRPVRGCYFVRSDAQTATRHFLWTGVFRFGSLRRQVRDFYPIRPDAQPETRLFRPSFPGSLFRL